MECNFKLERTEYLEGNFKRKEEFEELNFLISTNIGGKLEIGTLDDRETNIPTKLALKLTLEVNIENKKTEEEVAKMMTTHILIFDVDDNSLLIDIKKDNAKYQEIIKNMVNTGYLSIKEYIESTFSKAKMNIELPFTLMR